jgi:hypothetical protein
MAHYFFDSRDNGSFIRDDVGLEFDSIEEARDEAAVCLAEMAKFVLPGSDRRTLSIEVRDGAPVLTTSLVFEAVKLR